jgi:ATP-binding cassette subfamily B protein
MSQLSAPGDDDPRNLNNLMTSAEKTGGKVLVRGLFREVKPFGWHILALLALGLLNAPLTLLNPVPLKLVIDSVLGSKPLPPAIAALIPNGAGRAGVGAVAILAALFVLIAFFKQLTDFASSLLRTYTGERLVLSFRSKLFNHVQHLSLRYHDTRGTADSTYRIQYDAPAIQWIAVDALIPLASDAFTLIAMIAVMARLDPGLAVVALTITPVLFFVSQTYSRRLKVRWREAKDLESSTLGVVQEVLSSVRVVKAFAQEDRENQRYALHAGRNVKQQVALAITGGVFSVIVGMVMATGVAVVLFVGTLHVQSGVITLGEFILVMSYIGLLYTPLQNFSRSAASLQGSIASLERAFEVLGHAPEVEDRPHAQPMSRARGDVTFENVDFSYDLERPALRDVSFLVSSGSRVGISGSTGAGKSTLMSLLLRLYDPTRGRILLDGVDLRDIRLRDLRNQFAIVLQEPILFSSSIRENIAYGKADATDEEIVAAAVAANAHDFIAKLPEGYKTRLGERGVTLSGGERQRISLARAFLKNASLLILDEPTSSVDVKTEELILEAMERLMSGRTVFMIAHRMNTLELCDIRLEMQHGRLVSKTSFGSQSLPETEISAAV